ncbi:transient receptor potential channel pyrexia-like [Tenebrio molitor]|uniref:transient receptor potential channel pyrexia-like n=1 Tax=Tenebrio molitor TaxID=7067 RepID=UPI00362471EE
MAVISSLFVATTDTTKIEILQHPLFEIYLQHKWSKVIYLFYLWIALHVVSVACMTAYVSLLTYDIGYHDEALAVIRYIMVVVAPTLFIYGIIQCLVLRPFRFRRYEMWINFSSTILVLVVLGMEAWSGYGARVQEMPNWVLHMTSAAILLLWIELMMLIGRLPKYGYYAVMFGVVLKNVVKVLLACLCLVIGFALSFSIQFYHKEEFSDPWRALVKTVAMMMGEFDYVDIFHNRNYVQSSSPVSRVTFLVFVILTSIVLMNLMIGLAVNDIQTLKQEGHARKLQKRAEFLIQIEKIADKITCVSPFIRKLVDIDEIESLHASVNFLNNMKLSSKMNDVLFEIVQSRKIKNMHSDD